MKTRRPSPTSTSWPSVGASGTASAAELNPPTTVITTKPHAAACHHDLRRNPTIGLSQSPPAQSTVRSPALMTPSDLHQPSRGGRRPRCVRQRGVRDVRDDPPTPDSGEGPAGGEHHGVAKAAV